MSKRPLCRHMEVPPRRDGKVVAYAGKVYRCMVPPPPMPDLPNSVTLAYGFRWPTSRRPISTDECEGCPFYESRMKPAD